MIDGVAEGVISLSQEETKQVAAESVEEERELRLQITWGSIVARIRTQI